MSLNVKPPGSGWDLVALGEVMLRLDPGDSRIHTARRFDVWEGGGEYNVAKSLSQCFGLRTALASALADNPVGHLVEGLIRAGGVDCSNVLWREYDGVGREVRVGLNFTERGFGPRAPKGCSDRGLSAASQIQPGQIDWNRIFGEQGTRWLHTGGIFAALSPTSPTVVEEAILAAKAHGAIVSYDLNYRPSLWKSTGGPAKAAEVNRRLVSMVDMAVGNEEQFGSIMSRSSVDHLEQLADEFPDLSCFAVTLRTSTYASHNDWAGALFLSGTRYLSRTKVAMPIYDRIGGGDGFAAGVIYGLLCGKEPAWCVECGVAHGALVMTTPGDTSMATLSEVLEAMDSTTVRIDR